MSNYTRGGFIEAKARISDGKFTYEVSGGERFTIPIGSIKSIRLYRPVEDTICLKLNSPIIPFHYHRCFLYFRGEDRQARAVAFFEALKRALKAEIKKDRNLEVEEDIRVIEVIDSKDVLGTTMLEE